MKDQKGMSKIWILIIGILFVTSTPIYYLHSVARGTNEFDHNTDIGAVLYGIGSWKEMAKQDTNTLLSYYIMSDACYFAVDYPVGNRDYLYQDLQNNINQTKHKFVLPDIRTLYVSVWGGKHRIYNHQGFYFNYEEAQQSGNLKIDMPLATYREKRWMIGRDQVLIPAAASAFGLSKEDPRAEVVALFAYYAHMLGDTFEGDTSEMQTIKDMRGLISELEREVNVVFNERKISKPSSITSMQSELNKARKRCSELSCYSNYIDIKNILFIFVPRVLHEMGINVNNI